jgi:hypothetical protein
MLAYQAPGKVIASIAPQAGGGEQAIGGGKAHGRLHSPHERASVTVISHHYDQMMTIAGETAPMRRGSLPIL